MCYNNTSANLLSVVLWNDCLQKWFRAEYTRYTKKVVALWQVSKRSPEFGRYPSA